MKPGSGRLPTARAQCVSRSVPSSAARISRFDAGRSSAAVGPSCWNTWQICVAQIICLVRLRRWLQHACTLLLLLPGKLTFTSTFAP